MTTQEFSDAFDTLLASYNHKADFGDLSSYADVTLDEYEKSVFLTQALDNVVKNYFARQTNSLGEGFDDSTRRLVDFSSLIKVATLEQGGNNTVEYDVHNYNINNHTDTIVGTASITNRTKKTLVVKIYVRMVGTLLDRPMVLSFMGDDPFKLEYSELTNTISIQALNWIVLWGLLEELRTNPSFRPDISEKVTILFTNSPSVPDLGAIDSGDDGGTVLSAHVPVAETFDERGVIFKMPLNAGGGTDVLFVLNEKFLCYIGDTRKDFVVVPISYKEYDREMSRPFAQPLKKLAWRLFLNSSLLFDISTEVILKDDVINKANAASYVYKIRYVKRPKPIVLEDLPNNLSIDGVSIETPCELNPILHIDILEEAVRLALNSKGIETRDLKAAREAAKNRHN